MAPSTAGGGERVPGKETRHRLTEAASHVWRLTTREMYPARSAQHRSGTVTKMGAGGGHYARSMCLAALPLAGDEETARDVWLVGQRARRHRHRHRHRPATIARRILAWLDYRRTPAPLP
jgi:cytochrome b561